MEIGQFANAAMCLLVAEKETDYLLIHVLLLEIVSGLLFFFLFCIVFWHFRCQRDTIDTAIISKHSFGRFRVQAITRRRFFDVTDFK